MMVGNIQREEALYDVLIVGAGMAGLSAARVLAQAGQRVLLLEAQSRIGGRILTERVGEEVFELGAEFVHGRPAELLALIEEAGLTLVERDGVNMTFEEGTLKEREEAAPATDSEEQEDSGGEPDFFAPLETLENWTGPDQSFAEFIAAQDMPEEERQAVISYVEGFNAADHREISAASLGFQQKAEEENEGDRAFHIAGGYDQLPQFLAARFELYGGALRADTRVHRIEWQPGRVAVATNQGWFAARRAIVTLPLGVLQKGTVTFEPAPGEILLRAAQLRMGHATRLSLHLRERFWEALPPQPALSGLSFLFTREQLPSVWWTSYPEPTNGITGWVGGPRSEQLRGLSAEELGRRASAVLAEAFAVSEEYVKKILLGCYTHDWKTDPNSFGAYSYVATGGLDASRGMTEPVAETLYFAGEHTDTTGHWGTVHAALRSGLRAARQVLEAVG
jgi:monoamine oxidase